MFMKIKASIEKGIKETILSPSYLVGYFLWLFILSLVFGEIWSNLLKGEAANQTIFYFILAESLGYSFPRLGKEIEKEILEGKFDSRLLKPWNVILQYFFEGLGISFVRFCIFFTLLYSIFSLKYNFSVNLILPYLVFFVSYLAFFFLYFNFGITAFWVGRVIPILRILQKMQMLTQVIPFYVLPEYAKLFYKFLPGMYQYYFPIMMAINQKIYFEPFIYILVLMIFSFLYTKITMRKVFIHGG